MVFIYLFIYGIVFDIFHIIICSFSILWEEINMYFQIIVFSDLHCFISTYFIIMEIIKKRKNTTFSYIVLSTKKV